MIQKEPDTETNFKANIYPIILAIVAFASALGINLILAELRDIKQGQEKGMELTRENTTNIRLIQRDILELKEDSTRLQKDVEDLKKNILE